MGNYNKVQVTTGERYGFVTIIRETETINRKRKFDVKCDCGKYFNVALSNLRNGNTKSCGCKKSYKHGLSRSRIYKIWSGMKCRCNDENPKSKANKNYYSKGVKVCNEWANAENGFVNFYNWSMVHGYKDNLSIDRIDGTGNYEPSNCRWANYETQNTNLKKLSTNTSGYTGISWCKVRNSWRAIISIKNKTKTIGNYKTQIEAIEARNKYICDNHLPHRLIEVKE